MVVKHINGDAAGRGASVHEKHRFFRAEQVANVRLQVGEGGQVSSQLDPPAQLAFPWALELGGVLGQPIPLHLSALAPYR